MDKEKVSEDDLLKVFFSSKGTINRCGFLGFLWILSAVDGLFMDVRIISLILSLPIFYAALNIIQKRCRDFNYNGTIFLLMYSVHYLIQVCWIYVRPHKEEIKEVLKQNRVIAYFFWGSLVSFLLLLIVLVLIPGKKEKDPDLTSPLLKQPWKYVGICYSIYITAIIALFFLGY